MRTCTGRKDGRIMRGGGGGLDVGVGLQSRLGGPRGRGRSVGGSEEEREQRRSQHRPVVASCTDGEPK